VTSLAIPTTERVSHLREAFDSTFALPPRIADESVDLLAIRVAGTPYALRLDEIAGLYVDKVVTPVPGCPPSLRGIAGFRGTVVVVYDLRALLGGARGGPCRWLVTVAAESMLAFAFDHFEGHRRVPVSAIAGEQGAETVREAVQLGDLMRPIVRLSMLIDRITKPREGWDKER
jgi:purine-binding chemotaxis protein CheW